MSHILVLHLVCPLALAPLLFSVINRVKAMFGGRTGQPLLQTYYDIWKLLQKDFVYSTTATFIFRLAPVVGFSSMIAVLLLVPSPASQAIIAFPGDFVLLIYIFALARFFIIIAALDTGSAFEGMGSAREAFYSAIAELAVFIVIIAMALSTHEVSLSSMMAGLRTHEGAAALIAPAIFGVTFFIIMLLECSRIPFDDPNTHLELTMIHEVMVLDHGSLDLALVTYSSSLKLWIYSSLVAQFILPWTAPDFLTGSVLYLSGVFIIAAVVGVVESTLARLKLTAVPYILLGVSFFACFAFIFIAR